MVELIIFKTRAHLGVISLYDYQYTAFGLYRVSQKKVMPFVIQIFRELLVVEI
jgi:hypothetical protein